MLAWALCGGDGAHAQDSSVTPNAGAPAPSPPLIVRLEPLRAPPELLSGRLAPDGRDPSADHQSPALRGGSIDALELFVVIGADGHARLDDPLAPAALYEAIGAALSASVFQPAQAGGAPVAVRVRVRLP
ncbi:MAG TPA: hypothetical protein VJV78_06650, partial [Polyangiales bacterium]|nr:hypothetical protein [Polyangiales bacterium]